MRTVEINRGRHSDGAILKSPREILTCGHAVRLPDMHNTRLKIRYLNECIFPGSHRRRCFQCGAGDGMQKLETTRQRQRRQNALIESNRLLDDQTKSELKQMVKAVSGWKRRRYACAKMNTCCANKESLTADNLSWNNSATLGRFYRQQSKSRQIIQAGHQPAFAFRFLNSFSKWPFYTQSNRRSWVGHVRRFSIITGDVHVSMTDNLTCLWSPTGVIVTFNNSTRK